MSVVAGGASICLWTVTVRVSTTSGPQPEAIPRPAPTSANMLSSDDARRRALGFRCVLMRFSLSGGPVHPTLARGRVARTRFEHPSAPPHEASILNNVHSQLNASASKAISHGLL